MEGVVGNVTRLTATRRRLSGAGVLVGAGGHHQGLEPSIKRDWRPTGSRILPPDVAALLGGRGEALCYPKYFFHAEAKALLDPAYQKAIQQSEASVDDTLRAVTADVNERMRQLAATAR